MVNTHHLIAGDFNLHLVKPPNTSLQGKEELHTGKTRSNHSLAQCILDTKYTNISPIPTSHDDPTYTWYKTDDADSQKTTIDYIFGNQHTATHARAIISKES
jgi:endonuclease/exonuclease/phosphatase family metal-dependent hydrolase